MKRLLFLTTFIILLAFGHTALAQSNVDFAFFACEDHAVVELSGTVQSGYDIYYQIYMSSVETGQALSPMRRMMVDGDYAVSDLVTYTNGTQLGFGQVAAIWVSIARETDSSRSLFETTAVDGQDGCVEPTYPSIGSTEALDSGVEETSIGSSGGSSGIYTPDGGVLYARTYTSLDEPIVQIGARQSDIEEQGIEGRRETYTGLIFAECGLFYPQADPGTLFDTDPLTIFWSWYTRTEQQMIDHLTYSRYVVTFNGHYLPTNTSEIQTRAGNYWVFYTSEIGHGWRPGRYRISYDLTWDEPISDGYQSFGPETENEHIHSGCSIDILPNPWNVEVDHVDPEDRFR